MLQPMRGLDYEETFSFVVKMVMVRIVITFAINSNWSLFQLDINNVFLYGELYKHVYMSFPLGYHTKGDKRVCKLLKSLYVLKHAPRKWTEKLCSFLFDFRFVQSVNEFSLFVRNVNETIVVLLFMWMI